MIITFDNIIIDSFMSLGHIELDLKDSGYTLIKGENQNIDDSAQSNGSGKSSIWEALIWCLTGETLRGSKEVENIYTKNGAYVELNFQIDNNNNFKIIRTKNHKEYKTNLFIYQNDNDVSGKGIRDTEKLLKQYLPDLTAQLLGSVIVLGQGLPSKFTSNSPSGRKELLEQLSKSDFMIYDLKTRITNRANLLNQLKREQEDLKLATESKIHILEDIIKEDTSTLQNLQPKEYYENIISDNENQLSILNTQYNDIEIKLENESNQLLECKTKLNNLQIEKQNIQQQLKLDFEHGLSPIKTELFQTENLSKQLRKEIADAKAIKDICPTCGQKLPNIFKPDITEQETQLQKLLEIISQLQIQVKENNAQLEQQLLEIEHNFIENNKQLKNEISNLELEVHNLQNNKNTLLTNIRGIQSNITQAKNSIEWLENQLITLQQRINEKTYEINEYNQIIKQTTDSITNFDNRLNIIKKFDTIIKRDFRGYLLTEVIKYINTKCKEYCLDIFGTDYINFELVGNNISISYNNKEYEMLSGGERQKLDLIIQFSIRDMLCDYLGFNSSLLVLDEIFDNLDAQGCDKVISTISKRLSNVNSIYIISHHADELNIPADNYLTIIKDKNGISRIKQ